METSAGDPVPDRQPVLPKIEAGKEGGEGKEREVTERKERKKERRKE